LLRTTPIYRLFFRPASLKMLEIALLFLCFLPRRTKKSLAKSAWCEANTDLPMTLPLISSS
jgi:hypothetical protein